MDDAKIQQQAGGNQRTRCLLSTRGEFLTTGEQAGSPNFLETLNLVERTKYNMIQMTGTTGEDTRKAKSGWDE